MYLILFGGSVGTIEAERERERERVTRLDYNYHDVMQ